MNKNVRGFTIVELLIVIVVIAILAAISIVAYNGIQARADVSARQSVITAYFKKFGLFSAEFNRMPLTSVAADRTALDLGALQNDMLFAANPTSLGDCVTSAMTKNKYCVVTGQGIIWWNKQTNKWTLSYSKYQPQINSRPINPTVTETWPTGWSAGESSELTITSNSLGSGTYPTPAAYDYT